MPKPVLGVYDGATTKMRCQILVNGKPAEDLTGTRLEVLASLQSMAQSPNHHLVLMSEKDNLWFAKILQL
jgi:hypothetical protein